MIFFFFFTSYVLIELLHLPALLLELKMPPLRMKMKSASAHLHSQDSGSCCLGPGTLRWWWEITSSSWQVVGAAMW